LDSLNSRAELSQLRINIFVAPIQMVNPVDLSGAARRESSNHERGGGPEIAGHHWRAAQGLSTLHDRARSFDGNLRAETCQLAYVHEARFENALRDDAESRRERHQRHHLRLGIRRE